MFHIGSPVFVGSNFLQALGWAIINSLWQMAFLWVIFHVVLSFGVQKSYIKSRLASLFVTAGFIWFLFTFVWHWLVSPGTPKMSLLSMNYVEGNDLWNRQLQIVLPYASLLYLLLLLVPGIQFIRNYRYVQALRRNELSKSPVDLRMFVRRFAERMGIRKPVHVYISNLITSPVTIGFLKPIILMPIAAINSLTTKQVEAVLLHELAHIRRYDYFLNLLVNVFRTILYFNPFVTLFAKTIEREREKSCDEIVIQFQYDPHGYASALLVLERNNSFKQSMAVAVSGQRNDLLHRIEKILGIEKQRSLSGRRMGGLLAGLFCIIAMNAILFLSAPVIKDRAFTYTAFSNPFFQLVTDGKENMGSDKIEVPKPVQAPLVAEASNSKPETNPEKVYVVTAKPTGPDEHFVLEAPAQNAKGFAFITVKEQLEKQLKHSEMKQVKGAVAATKKVLEEEEWKQVEKNIADAMTLAEKQNAKQDYLSQMKQYNWQNLEEKLKQQYDQINWNQVNAKLNSALTNITLDSLTNVYNLALDNLDKAEVWMNDNKVECIPDTDVKLNEIKDQQTKIEKELKLIKGIKEKTIIHL